MKMSPNDTNAPVLVLQTDGRNQGQTGATLNTHTHFIMGALKMVETTSSTNPSHHVIWSAPYRSSVWPRSLIHGPFSLSVHGIGCTHHHFPPSFFLLSHHVIASLYLVPASVKKVCLLVNKVSSKDVGINIFK